MIESTNAHGRVSTCSASLVAADILITAAHCIKDKGSEEFRKVRLVGNPTLNMVRQSVHPLYQDGARYDVALIKLESRVPHARVLVVADRPVNLKDRVRLVGFGGNHYDEVTMESSGRGVKRWGYTKVTAIDDHFIYSRGILNAASLCDGRPTGEKSGVATGDSGGPMLDQNGAILGIAVKVNTHHRADTTVPTVVNAHIATVYLKDFIKQALDDLGNKSD